MSGGRSGSPPFRDKRMNHDTGNKARWIRRVRIWLALFIAGLVLSGITAFPLKRELSTILGIPTKAGAATPRPMQLWDSRP
jgi:hypothetical protein